MGQYHHDAILQRLDVYHSNDGRRVYYSAPAFSNTEDWEHIPVIMAENPAQGHPAHGVAESGVPTGYRVVGYVTDANIPTDGTARLAATLVLDDSTAERLASDGKLAISTCFRSTEEPDGEGNYVISSKVIPDHVLAFEQGAEPNCYPNDQGAMLTNQVEVHEMTESKQGLTEEDKGFIAGLLAKFHKNQDSEEELRADATVDIEELKKEIEELKRQLAERDAIIAEMKQNEEDKEKDKEWECMRNQIPEGWLADESATRAEFEASPAQFAAKLATHIKTHANMQQAAEGAASANTTIIDKQQQYIDEIGKKFGIEF